MENGNGVHLQNPHLLSQIERKFPHPGWPLEVYFLGREGEVEKSPHRCTSGCRQGVSWTVHHSTLLFGADRHGVILYVLIFCRTHAFNLPSHSRLFHSILGCTYIQF